MFAHMDNLEQMDRTQLEGLLMSLVQMCGPDVLTQMNSNPQQLQSMMGMTGFGMPLQRPPPPNLMGYNPY